MRWTLAAFALFLASSVLADDPPGCENASSNIEIGACAKIAAGSVVLDPVPAGCTAAGVPARIIGCVDVPEPALDMDHRI